MDYNSSREDIIMTEYGRHVQDMIAEAKKVEDPEERQAMVEKIVELMMILNPQSRGFEEYQEKMWKHVFRVAKYDLEVAPPAGINVSPEDAAKHPERIGYPSGEARFRHYGHNVQRLIKKALEMEEGPVRDGFVEVIGSYMKLAYRTWNKEHYVSDDVIKGDLESLSNGKLTLADEVSLDNLATTNTRRKPVTNTNERYDRNDRNDRGDRGGGYRGGSDRYSSGGGRGGSGRGSTSRSRDYRDKRR